MIRCIDSLVVVVVVDLCLNNTLMLGNEDVLLI